MNPTLNRPYVITTIVYCKQDDSELKNVNPYILDYICQPHIAVLSTLPLHAKERYFMRKLMTDHHSSRMKTSPPRLLGALPLSPFSEIFVQDLVNTWIYNLVH